MEWANYISRGVAPHARGRKLIGGNWKCNGKHPSEHSKILAPLFRRELHLGYTRQLPQAHATPCDSFLVFDPPSFVSHVVIYVLHDDRHRRTGQGYGRPAQQLRTDPPRVRGRDRRAINPPSIHQSHDARRYCRRRRGSSLIAIFSPHSRLKFSCMKHIHYSVITHLTIKS